AGIHAALTSKHASLWNLVLSVDIPAISPEYLKYILTAAMNGAAQVTVHRAGGHLQTLCGVYRREFATVAEPALRDGHNKIEPLLAEVTTRILEEEGLKALGFA